MTWVFFFNAPPIHWLAFLLVDVFDDYIGYTSICNWCKVLSYRMAVDPYLPTLLWRAWPKFKGLTQICCLWTIWMDLTWDQVICPFFSELGYWFTSDNFTWRTKGQIFRHGFETIGVCYKIPRAFCRDKLPFFSLSKFNTCHQHHNLIFLCLYYIHKDCSPFHFSWLSNFLNATFRNYPSNLIWPNQLKFSNISMQI